MINLDNQQREFRAFRTSKNPSWSKNPRRIYVLKKVNIRFFETGTRIRFEETEKGTVAKIERTAYIKFKPRSRFNKFKRL